jgi:hypothetical protein
MLLKFSFFQIPQELQLIATSTLFHLTTISSSLLSSLLYCCFEPSVSVDVQCAIIDLVGCRLSIDGIAEADQAAIRSFLTSLALHALEGELFASETAGALTGMFNLTSNWI